MADLGTVRAQFSVPSSNEQCLGHHDPKGCGEEQSRKHTRSFSTQISTPQVIRMVSKIHLVFILLPFTFLSSLFLLPHTCPNFNFPRYPSSTSFPHFLAAGHSCLLHFRLLFLPSLCGSFLTTHSTIKSPLVLAEWLKIIVHRKAADKMYLDFQKSFDKVLY